MLKEERQTIILKEINLHNKVLSSDLSTLLNISEDTVRRDLNELAETGMVIKVHGGALSKSFHFPFRETEIYAMEAKKEIARKSLSLIKNDMVLLVGGGTTMIELARMIPSDLKAMFFTISPLVALELAEHANIDVHLIGGRLSKDSHVNIGAHVINRLSEIKVDLCFLGTNGLSLEAGVTDSDWEVVQVKNAMIKSAEKTAIITISEKLGSIQKMKICNLNALDHLITDLKPDNAILTEYAKAINII